MNSPNTNPLSIKRNLIWNTIGCSIYQGCQWLMTILVVWLSSSYENSGVLAFAMATGNIFSALSTYNMRTVQVSDIKNEYTPNDYTALRIVTIIGAIVLCIVYSFVISPTLQTSLAMVCYLLFRADESFANVLYGVDQKASRMDYIGVSQALRGVICIITFCLFLVFTHNLCIAFLGMFAGCLIVTLCYDLPHSRNLSSLTPSFNKETITELLRRYFPSVLSILLYASVSSVARQWFGIEYGEDALGIYAAVATPCVLVQLLANYLYSPFLVPIAEHVANKDTAGAVKKILMVIAAILVVSIFCFIVCAFVGPSLVIAIYGEDIQDYAWLITPAIVAASMIAFACFATDLFILLRNFVCAVTVNAIALGVTAVSMSGLYNLFYMNGINIVIIISFLLGIIGGIILFLVRKKDRWRTNEL